MKLERNLSEFATKLKYFLDATNTFTRSGWATVLGLSTPAITQWTKDDTFPRPESLRRIRRTLEEDITVPDSVIEEFDELAAKPLEEIAPHANRRERTLAHYLVVPIREAFLEVLDTLMPAAQEEVLLKASALARQTRDSPRNPSALRDRRALARGGAPSLETGKQPAPPHESVMCGAAAPLAKIRVASFPALEQHGEFESAQNISSCIRDRPGGVFAA